MTLTLSRHVLLPTAAIALLGLALTACSGDDAVGSSASYTGTATATATTTSGATESTDTADTIGTTDSEGGSVSDSQGTTVGESETGGETTTTTTGVEPLVLDCGDLPLGAVGATYNHSPAASGGVPGYMWQASGLPEGLVLNAFTGQIGGAPTTAGDYTVELTVADSGGSEVSESCPLLTIAAGLAVDLDAIDGPCITGEASLLEVITGGDGTPITCSIPGGTGNGRLPSGLSVDSEACTITGTLAETRYGTWAWIVRAQQSGVAVYAPYCATQPIPSPGAYAIKGTHGGGDQLTPAVATFTPDDPVRFNGDGEPRFEVTDVCGDTCYYGYFYAVSASPFGSGACVDEADGCYGLCPMINDKQEPCTLLPELGLPKVGFAHEMWAKGAPVSPVFVDRPWILQWSLDYCMSPVSGDCTTKEGILSNGKETNLEFAVIMRPKG